MSAGAGTEKTKTMRAASPCQPPLPREVCLRPVLRGAALRLLATAAVLAQLWYAGLAGPLVVALALAALDEFDGAFIRGTDARGCHKHFRYQIVDKCVDLLSYVLVLPLYYAASGDPLRFWWNGLAGRVAMRLAGVALFAATRNARVLVLFPDLVKESLALYGAGVREPAAFVGVGFIKMFFESYHHGTKNPPCYQATAAAPPRVP